LREGCAKNGSIRATSLGLAVAFFMLLVPGLAEAGWSGPVTVSGAGSSTSQTRVDGTSDGTSWVVWKRDVGGFDVIQATKVQIDGTQGPILTVSGPTFQSTDPVVAVREDGSALVAWLNLSATDDTVHSASIAADGTVGPVMTRSTVGPVGQPAKDISVAVGEDGTACLTWIKYNGTNWVVQAVKIAADGTSGTIHDLSDGSTISAGTPDVGTVPPATTGGANSYRIFWPQGSGVDSNVGSREISSTDTVSDLYLAFAPETGGDPFDVQVVYGSDGSLNAMWIRYRKDIDLSTGTFFYNWAAEWLRLGKGVQPVSGDQPIPSPIVAASPTVLGVPYNLSSLYLTQATNGLAVAAWIHDLNGGGQRVETWRALPNGTGQGWANPSSDVPAVTNETIAANSTGAAVSGWTIPGALPGQEVSAWTRFSNTSFEQFTPAGSFVYSTDPGFVMATNGKTLAAFTAIDGVNVGTSRVYTFTDPGFQVEPDNLIYGPVAVGQPNKRFITIRSTGESATEVTGVSLSGANAGQFALSGVDACLRSLDPATVCQVGVTFTPGSTGAKTAAVTVTSDAGVEITNLTGSGINRTRNSVTASPRNSAVRKGRVVRVTVKAKNVGGTNSNSTRVCANWRKRAMRLSGNGCRSLGSLPAGSTRNLTFRFKVLGRAPRGTKLPVIFRMTAGNAVVRQAVVNIRRKGN